MTQNKALYDTQDIFFTVAGCRIHALNIIYEKLSNMIPQHSHGSGCYEIHYISSGYGTVQISDVIYDVTPGTVYVTGPHAVHAQLSRPEDPMCEYCVYLLLEKRRSGESCKNDEMSVLKIFEENTIWFGKDCGEISSIVTDLFS